MSQLFATLVPKGISRAELAYVVLSDAGVVTAAGQAGAALLPKASKCTLIVPVEAMSWHPVQLPKLPRGMSAQKLQSVLVGLLEEQLLDDPASLHLVLMPSNAGAGAAWVAACDKGWLKNEVSQLQQAGLTPSSIVPQAFPLDICHAHVSGSADEATMTLADAQGVVVWPLWQAGLLPLAEVMVLTAEPAVAASAEAALGRRVEVMQASAYAAKAVLAAKEQGYELAQGDLALAGRGRFVQYGLSLLRDILMAPAWRAARWGVGLLVIVQLAGLNAWAWKQSANVQAKRAEMNQLLTQSFPNVKVIVDAPLQLQRELTALRQSQGQLSGRDFESIYARISSSGLINAAPNAIDFVSGEVSLRGTGLAPSQMEALRPKLAYAGLSMRSDDQKLIVSQLTQSGGQR